MNSPKNVCPACGVGKLVVLGKITGQKLLQCSKCNKLYFDWQLAKCKRCGCLIAGGDVCDPCAIGRNQ